MGGTSQRTCYDRYDRRSTPRENPLQDPHKEPSLQKRQLLLPRLSHFGRKLVFPTVELDEPDCAEDFGRQIETRIRRDEEMLLDRHEELGKVHLDGLGKVKKR